LNAEVVEPAVHGLVVVAVYLANLLLLNFKGIEGCGFAGL
jgi:hypothetical protein